MNFFAHRYKFLFLLSALFLVAPRLKSQVYFKIPADTNHYWRQFSLCLTTPTTVNRYDYQIRYYKDTTVNSKVYNLYQRFGRSWGYEFCPSFTKRGFIRQDTLAKKVFILDGNFVERPLYNFAKVVGDTLQHYNKSLNSVVTLTVQHLDTAYLFDGTKHKAQWVSNNNCFIEGVGSIFGGLYGDDQMMNTPNNISEQLMCYGLINPFFNLMDGITQQTYICSLVPATVGIPDFTNPNSISIFPNPTSSIVKIIFDGGLVAKAQLVNALGQVVFSNNELYSGQEIDLVTLPSGVYFLHLSYNNCQRVVKLIRE